MKLLRRPTLYHEALAHFLASNRDPDLCLCEDCDAIREIRKRWAK